MGEERFLHFQNLRTLLPRVGVLENTMTIYSKWTSFFFYYSFFFPTFCDYPESIGAPAAG